EALSSGFHSTAIGGESVASATGAQAFGWQARATANLTLAVGHQAVASGPQATALGKNANASGANSTAVGFGATATADNQVVLGGAGSSVRIGDIAASTALQQASSANLATVDANGVLGRSTIAPAAITTLQTTVAAQGTSITALQATQATQGTSIAALQGQTATLFDLSDINRRGIRKANEGVAMALAMETPGIPTGANFAVSGGVGYYENRTAATAAFSARVGEMSAVSAGVGVGLNTGEVGARAGFQMAW
ncbi:MAG TPA: YadA-like family protein, partial [Lautropia sp.]|nr:YadA-like family protein [Lautropia sp.]